MKAVPLTRRLSIARSSARHYFPHLKLLLGFAGLALATGGALQDALPAAAPLHITPGTGKALVAGSLVLRSEPRRSCALPAHGGGNPCPTASAAAHAAAPVLSAFLFRAGTLRVRF